MPAIQLERVSKVFGQGTVGLADLTLNAGTGELLILVVPSSSGKTTVLRLIAGLDSPTEGRIRLHGQAVDSVPPWRRGVALVSQRPALYPTRTVWDNLALPVQIGKPRRWKLLRPRLSEEDTADIR